MRRAVLLWFMVLSLLVAAPGLARGQLQDVTQTGNLTATATAAACVNGTSCVQVSLQGLATVGVTLSGTWVGTITPEISIDGGTTWTATNFYNVNTQATVATVTANGQYRIVDTAGAGLARVRVSAYTSGTVVVTLRVTVATAGGAGRVTGSGTATKLAVWTSGTALGDYAGATSCTNQFMTGLSAAGASTCTSPTLAGAQFVNQGTTTTLLHGNALGNPSWSAVSLTADVTGTLPLANGGTNATTFTTSNGIVKYDGTRLVTGLLTDNGTTVAGPAGTTLALAATAPAQAAGATAGTAATYTAGNATAGASVAGAAAGGSVTITAGNAARLTSGNANGGDIALVPGAGIGTGASGNVTVSAGSVLTPDGSASAPVLARSAQTNTGVYLSGNTVALSANGTASFGAAPGGAVVGGGLELYFSSTGLAADRARIGSGDVSSITIKASDGTAGSIYLLTGGLIGIVSNNTLAFNDQTTTTSARYAFGAGTGASITTGQQAHLQGISSFIPGSGSASYAALHLNPTINGTSSGTAYGLLVASKTNTLTGGTVKLLSLGTTTTDGFTGYSMAMDVSLSGDITAKGFLATGTASPATSQVGAIYPGVVAQAALNASATNGQIVYCSDCTIANPCAGAGTGALAKRLNGVWVCN